MGRRLCAVLSLYPLSHACIATGQIVGRCHLAIQELGAGPVMPRQTVLTAIILAIVIGVSVPLAASAEAPQAAGWPLSKGAYWVYEGNVTWYNAETDQTAMQNVTWRVEVIEVVQRDHVTGYLVRGALDDLANYEAGAAPAEHVIIQVGADKFYASNADALARLRADVADDILADLIQPELQLLELPLQQDQVFGDPQQITRTDRMYAWWVTDVQAADVKGIKGVPSGLSADQYTLSLRTLGDSTTMDFVPGLGVVQYRYEHYGTPAAVSVRLVEFHAGQ
jgi:hypothetical protein